MALCKCIAGFGSGGNGGFDPGDGGIDPIDGRGRIRPIDGYRRVGNCV